MILIDFSLKKYKTILIASHKWNRNQPIIYCFVFFFLPFQFSLDKPRDGVPTETTNKETLLQQQADKAAEILEGFDITAAAKLVQKRRLPFGNIITDEHRLSDDESTPVENNQRGERRAPFRPGQGDGVKKAKLAAAPAANQSAKQNTAQQAVKKQGQAAATPNKANAGNAAKNNANANTANNGNRPARNLNGVSPASRAIVKQKRPNNNLNRGNAPNLLRNNGGGGGGGGGGGFRKNNDLGGNFNNRGGGGFDRNNEGFDSDFTRRPNLSSGGDFGRGQSSFGSLGLGLGLGSPWSGNSGGNNSFGRNFNNGNRF